MGDSDRTKTVRLTIEGSNPQGRSEAPLSAAAATAISERAMMEGMQIVKKSIDYAMILASAGLASMVAILLLQGFKIGGFYLDVSVLTALVPSLSAAAALKVLGRASGRAVPGDVAP